MLRCQFLFLTFSLFGILQIILSAEKPNVSELATCYCTCNDKDPSERVIPSTDPPKFLGDLIRWIEEMYHFNKGRASDAIQVAGLISDIQNAVNLLKMEVQQKFVELEEKMITYVISFKNELKLEMEINWGTRICNGTQRLQDKDVPTLVNQSSMCQKEMLDPQQDLEYAREKYERALKRQGKSLLLQHISEDGSGSCLRKGTSILLSNGDEKPVEDLKVGDILVDHKLNPTKVLGISSEFLLGQTFYGFDNKSFYFTDSHLLVGPSKDLNGSVQFYVKDKQRLLLQNPLMEFIQVDKMPGDDFEIFQYEKVNRIVSSKWVKLFKDPVVHPMDTMVYFIQVDSPSGTYFANGFACRHEIPPIQFWPNTMAVLFSVLSNPDLDHIKNIPYTLTSLLSIYKVVADVQSKIVDSLRLLKLQDLNTEDPIMEVDIESYELVVGNIFNNPSFSAFGMGLYAKIGPVLSRYLDNCDKTTCIFYKYLGSLQELVGEVILEQTNKSFQSRMSLG